MAHRRPASTRDNRSHSKPMLTVALRAVMAKLRERERDGFSLLVATVERRAGIVALNHANGESYVDLCGGVPYNFKDRLVKILMIAPEPFFEPRGTPFSEYHRIRALLELGHTVDLVTYPFGRDVSLPGLRVFRCLRPPFVNSIGIGPSWAKIPLDALVACTSARRALSGRYDVVHSHEEGSWFGVVIAGMLGVPHLYDMHSSLPQQLSNFSFSRSRALVRTFAWLERFVIRRSKVVVV